MNNLPPRPTSPSPTPPSSAAWLYQAATGQPHPLTITEHPVRCPAELEGIAMSGHLHACVHPAKRPDGVVGVLVHLCYCGATWDERTSAGETKTSNEED